MKTLARQALVHFLLAVLILAGCTPVVPKSTATPGTPVATHTTGVTLLPTSSPSPYPPIGVDPAALRGLTIRAWDAFTGSADLVYGAQVVHFNAVNEWGIVVTRTSEGDYPTLFDAVSTAIDSGAGTPDLVAALPEETLAWDHSGAVVDLAPYVADPVWGLGKGGLNIFPGVFLAQDRGGVRQLGLPAQRSASFLFYNQTWAKELGFVHPPATADEFRQQACAANASFRTDANLQNDGYGGWMVDTHWQTIYSWILAFGGGVVNGDTYTFSTDPNLGAMQFLKGLKDDSCAWLADTTTTTPLEPLDAFARRLSLFVSGDMAEVPLAGDAMVRQKNNDVWTLIPYPGKTGQVLVTYGPSYSLLRSTPEKQLAAWLFARWLLSPENQAQWVDATGLFPLLNSLPATNPSPQWTSAVADLTLAQGVPQLASWRKVRYVLEDGANYIFQTNLRLDLISAILREMDTTAGEIK